VVEATGRCMAAGGVKGDVEKDDPQGALLATIMIGAVARQVSLCAVELHGCKRSVRDTSTPCNVVVFHGHASGIAGFEERQEQWTSMTKRASHRSSDFHH
jgi:hypothetical protein